MKNSFVLYTEYKEQIDLLSLEEKGLLLDAIYKYVTGEEVELNGMVKMAFSFIKNQLDRDNEKYEATCEKRKEAGSKGGAPKGNKNASKQPKQANGCKNNQNKQKQAKQPDNEDEYEDDNDDVDVNEDVNEDEDVHVDEKKKSGDKPHRFTPPTFEEVRDYCMERGNGINPQAFIDFYSSKGWMVGKNKMKDWKAAVRTWEQRNNNKGSPPTKVSDDFFRRRMMGL